MQCTYDYYTFGQEMPGRTYNASSSTFGFNGKLKDNEVYGSDGTSYDYGFRIYNPRIARFLSTDPLTSSYPWYTPYQFSGNMPIAASDMDGLEEYIVIYDHAKNKKVSRIQVIRYEDVSGKPRNNEVTENGTRMETQNVLIIHRYADGTETKGHAKSLEPNEQAVRDNANRKEKAVKGANGAGKSRVQYGAILGKEFDNGTYVVNSQDFDVTPKFNGKSIEPGAELVSAGGYIAAPGPLAQGGTLGSSLKQYISGLTAAVNQGNDIQTVTISIKSGIGTSVGQTGVDEYKRQLNTVLDNVILEMKKNGLDKNIQIKKGDVDVRPSDGPAAKDDGVNFSIQ